MFSLPSRFALALSTGLLAGCGGGGLFEPEPETVFVTLASDPVVDGFVTSGGAVVPNSATNAVAVGDNSADDARRGIYRFDIGAIPPGATLVSATLRLFQADTDSVPYALGSIRVDHVDVGAGLDAADFGAAALASNIGTLSTDAVLELKAIDVTSTLAVDLAAARTTSDYRLRFTVGTDGDGTTDSAKFEDASNNLGSGVVPALLVTFIVP